MKWTSGTDGDPEEPSVGCFIILLALLFVLIIVMAQLSVIGVVK